MPSQTYEQMSRIIQTTFLDIVPWVSAALFIPNFLFGIICVGIFKGLPPGKFTTGYFYDLCGGAIGCILAYVVLEKSTSFWILTIPSVLLFASCLFLNRSLLKRSLLSRLLPFWALGPVILVFVFGPAFFEPKPQLDLASFNYDRRGEVEMIWGRWTSYTHTSLVKKKMSDSEIQYWLSHGNGESIGLVPFYQSSPEPSPLPEGEIPALVNILGIPQKALVLFSGLGNDMLLIDRASKGKTHITGVELNARLLEGATAALPQANLDRFFALPHIAMHWNEARVFLENSRNRYDVIFVSWSGAIWAYLNGAVSPTAQSIFTIEGLMALLKNLNPDGLIVVMNPQNLLPNLLHGLGEILHQGDHSKIKNAVIALERIAENTNRNLGGPLLIKPAGFKRDDFEKIQRALSPYNLRVAISPWTEPVPSHIIEYQILKESSRSAVINDLEKRTQKRLRSFTDDWPFGFDLHVSTRYLSAEFWKEVLTGSPKGRDFRSWLTLSFLLACTATLALVLARRSGSAQDTHYFAALGFGYTCIQICVLQKMTFFIGHPGLTLIVVLANLLFFGGLGSLLTPQRGGNSRILISLAAWAILFLAVDSFFKSFILGQSTVLRCLICTVTLAPGAFLLGSFFPRGLHVVSAGGTSEVAWGWAMNGCFSLIAVFLTPLLAQVTGFRLALGLGIAAYLSILLNKKYRTLSGR